MTYTSSKWSGARSRFSLPQLLASVPRAVAAYARKQAKKEKRDLTKGDLTLPFKEPAGEVNLNAVRSALAVLGGARGGVRLPPNVQAAARRELERELKRGKKALGAEQATAQSVVEITATVIKEQDIDEAEGRIRGVKLLGRESQNGPKDYTDAALDSAAAIYEGAPINVDHPFDPSTGKLDPYRPRGFNERLGFARNVESRHGDGVYGDIHCCPTHPAFERLKWFAKNPRSRVGVSANHDITGVSRAGRFQVEAVTSVRGLDIVADPATVRAVHEQKGANAPREGETMEIHTTDDLRREFPDLVRALEQEGAEGRESTALEQERDALQKRVAELEAVEKRRERAKRITAIITEQKADRVVTDTFRTHLESLQTDEEVVAAIKDRLSIAAPERSEQAPSSRGKSPAEQQGGNPTTEQRDRPTDVDSFVSFLKGA